MKLNKTKVQQIIKEYMEAVQESVLGENVGRPRKPYIEKRGGGHQSSHSRYRFGASML